MKKLLAVIAAAAVLFVSTQTKAQMLKPDAKFVDMVTFYTCEDNVSVILKQTRENGNQITINGYNFPISGGTERVRGVQGDFVIQFAGTDVNHQVGIAIPVNATGQGVVQLLGWSMSEQKPRIQCLMVKSVNI